MKKIILFITIFITTAYLCKAQEGIIGGTDDFINNLIDTTDIYVPNFIALIESYSMVTEADPVFTAWDKNYSDLTNKPTIPTASDVAYSSTTWNGNTDVPTKNVVRDKFELVTLSLGSYELLSNKQTNLTASTTKYPTVNAVNTGLGTKQATLVSGTNIRTINSTSLLGSGNISTIQTTITGNAGTATKLQTARTIAGVSFDGSANISLNNYSIINGAGYITGYTETDPVYSAWNKSYNDLINKPTIPVASNLPYDATSWNGNTDVPTKDAVRDKIETLASGGDGWGSDVAATDGSYIVGNGTTLNPITCLIGDVENEGYHLVDGDNIYKFVTGQGYITNNQTIDQFYLSGTNLYLSLQNDGQTAQSVNLSSLSGDGPILYTNYTNRGNLGDNEGLNFMSGTNAIVSYSTTYDNTITFSADDDQTVDVFSLSGSTLSLSLESDGQSTKTVTFGTMATKNFWNGSQAEYDALGCSYDIGTIYFINQ